MSFKCHVVRIVSILLRGLEGILLRFVPQRDDVLLSRVNTDMRLIATKRNRSREMSTRMARLYEIPRNSSHKASTPSSLKGKVLAISENVPDPVDTSKSLVVLLNRSFIVLMLVGSHV